MNPDFKFELKDEPGKVFRLIYDKDKTICESKIEVATRKQSWEETEITAKEALNKMENKTLSRANQWWIALRENDLGLEPSFKTRELNKKGV